MPSEQMHRCRRMHQQQQQQHDVRTKQGDPPVNLLFFLMLFTVVGAFGFLNAVEYFAHQNCPAYGRAWYWHLIPRLVTCFKVQLT